MSKTGKGIKAPALTLPAPKTREEADQLIFKLGQLQRDRIDLETAMNEALAASKLEHENLAKPINGEIAALMASIQTWCEANREDLCPGKLKTYKFGNGEVSWRLRPASVTLRNIEKIINWCEEHLGLERFLRVKTEINKEAMLAEPEIAQEIPGVKIGSAGEDFIVKPFESELEEIGNGKNAA